MNHNIRNWLYPLLSALAVMVVLLSLANYKTKAHNYEECASAANIAALDDIKLNTAIDPKYKTKQTDQNRHDISSKISCSDLSAQWAMSDIAMMGYIAGLLGLVFLGITVYETKSAADMTRLALGETKANSKRELRAYLSTYVSAKNIYTTRNIPTLEIVFLNKGSSPAINVGYHAIGYGADEHTNCNVTIPPNESYTVDWPLEGFNISDKDLEEIFNIDFFYSDIFGAERWVKTEFFVTSDSFPTTKVTQYGHATERRIQFTSFRDDLKDEAEEYKKNNKPS